MKSFLNTKYKWILTGIIIVSLIMFAPSLFNNFTHDDFFHLKISNIGNVSDFIKIFYISPEGWGLYRPISTQLFYSISTLIFGVNPLPMHLIMMILFGIIIYLVYDISKNITRLTTLSLTATFLYALSVTHFGQLYFPATQELWLGIFYFGSISLFLKYLDKRNKHQLIFSIILFVLALMSKEFAVTLPFSLLLFAYYKKKIKKPFYIIPYFVILIGYFVFRFYYGFTTGDSYLWDISPRIINTTAWYLFWSLNIPEMFVDFIGPGFRINSNLFAYWGREVNIILFLFSAQVFGFISLLIMHRKKIDWKLICAGVLFFVGTLFPVLFLPLHKYAFYLTVPLFGVVMVISELMTKSKVKEMVLVLLVIWVALSYFTINLTKETHWITNGAGIVTRVDNYFKTNTLQSDVKLLCFVDTKNDSELPWLPSAQVKNALSNEDYFVVHNMNNISVFYGNQVNNCDLSINARQFLGY